MENAKFNTVCVLGLGYIGLPTATILASHGLSVLGVDINPDIVNTLNQGQLHFSEPELAKNLQASISEGKFKASLNPENADVFIIAVPTPFQANYDVDLQYIEAACAKIAPYLQKNNCIVLESTVPVGTTEYITSLLADLRPDLVFPPAHNNKADINIAYCPERVMPGKILTEMINNNRIIGGITVKCAEKVRNFYELFVKGKCLVTQVRAAEMCKLAENSFRDVNIAFANELSIICDQLNINVWELIYLANQHPRVNILKPGPGVGGHCIAVDPWFIVNKNPKEARLIKSARIVNDSKPAWIIKKLKILIDNCLQNNPTKTIKDLTIACLGLSYKANSDDLRESPAVKIAKALISFHPGPLFIVEPNISILPIELKQHAQLKLMHEIIPETDILIVLVPHADFNQYYPLLKNNCIVFDTCGAMNNNLI